MWYRVRVRERGIGQSASPAAAWQRIDLGGTTHHSQFQLIGGRYRHPDSIKGGVPVEKTEVVVVDVKMPFMSMVVFMVKWVVAAIPAFIILAVLGAMFSGFLIGFIGNM